MVEKKVAGVKSVSLGDVRSAQTASGIKTMPSASSSSDADLDQGAKDIDDNVKKRDEEAKQTDQEWKQADKAAKKLDQKRKIA